MAIDLTRLPRYPPVPENSREPVKARITAFDHGKPVDPSAAGGTCAFAFVPTEPFGDTYHPGTADFFDGEFEKSGEGWFARVLVGSGGGVPLSVGEYVVWCQVTNAPEQPTRAVAILPVV